MPIWFRVATKEIGKKEKKEIIIYQCQCGYIVTSEYEKLLLSHLKVHSLEARVLTNEMEKFFKSRYRKEVES